MNILWIKIIFPYFPHLIKRENVKKKKKKICLKKSLPYIDRKTKEKRKKK
jgi:hypothetical protein